MATASPRPHSRVMRAYAAIDRSAEHMFGADTRLLYGFEIPILAVVGAVIGFSFHARWWLVAVIVALEVALLTVVVLGFVRMLGQDEDESVE